MPNPLTDELSPEAKAELAALFNELRAHYPPVMHTPVGMVLNQIRRNRRQYWEHR